MASQDLQLAEETAVTRSPQDRSQRICSACSDPLVPDSDCHSSVVCGHRYFLCETCWHKVRRDGRYPAQVLAAVARTDDPAFDFPGFPCDEGDVLDLQSLRLWDVPPLPASPTPRLRIFRAEERESSR
jgi:hypothetical protein